MSSSSAQPAAPGSMRWIEVAVQRPFPTPLTYALPAELPLPARGALVRVPLGRTQEIGVVLGASAAPKIEASKVRPILGLVEGGLALPEALVDLALWIADFYACGPGEALSACLPPAARQGRGARQERRARLVRVPSPAESSALEARAPARFRAVRTLREAGCPMPVPDLLRRCGASREALRALELEGWIAIDVGEREDAGAAYTGARDLPPVLSAEQRRAEERIAAALAERSFKPFLLHGVTGSGKTEVYLAAMQRALDAGHGAIFLVPEIALTTQTTQRLERRFGSVAILHSGLTEKMRGHYWRRIAAGEVRIVVGARSAILAPVPRLGLIVVDEEHEPSFKQQSTPRYHARDVAVLRAQREGAVVVLGSATPSFESWQNAREGRYELLKLEERVPGRALPQVFIIDMRGEQRTQGGQAVFSGALRTAITEALARQEQVLLLQNRRGYAPVLFCGACGTTLRCRQCDVSLTVHRKRNRALCHLCAEEVPATTTCPDCKQASLVLLGTGSERVEEVLSLEFPRARIRRMDSDTMLTRESYAEVYEAMSAREIDVLVGTQMIAKGLDFPHVTVVGVIQADTALAVPDFRAAERTYQLIAQVAGRSGRGASAGRVFVQSLEPEHDAIRRAAKNDFEGFAAAELLDRRKHGYPPFARFVRFQLEGEDEAKVLAAAEELHAELAPHCDEAKGLRLHRPAPAVVRLVRGRHRMQVLVRAKPPQALGALRTKLRRLARGLRSGVRVDLDVDPVGLW
ncbi:MAG: primosomal protein N' [Planctomycetes bacterium]|nr:primosomal protein N' [Planctomycetota bacterium]